MIKEKWMIQAKKADFNKIAQKYNISPVIARIIRNRDIITEADIDSYIRTDESSMNSPWLFKDMDKAVDIMNIRINQGNKIRIICDYDIDGICSGYILLDALKYVGANIDIVVPHRIEDGYGINNQLIDKALEDGIDLIITCDNGIAAIDAIKYAKEKGLMVIVTDHHEVQYEETDGEKRYILPAADAIIDQKQLECEYPFKDLCGAMVAYKFIEALYEIRGISAGVVKKYIEYAAIATIGDVVPLKGENRIITKMGLKMLRESKNIGLNALISECNVDKENISAYHIGFIIGPCLNASGRLDTAKKAIELIGCKNVEKAGRIAADLKRLNDDRKALTVRGTQKAIELAKDCEDKVLVIYLEECHESIAGIIAGRVREKYNKPTIVLTKTESMVKGSGRSIDNYNMFEELIKHKDILVKFGGHKMAAGVSLLEENVELLRKRLNESCTLTDEDMISKVWIDTVLPIEYVTFNFIEQLSILEPFGMGNEKPVFAARDMHIKSMKLIGADSTSVRMELISPEGYSIVGLCFNKAQDLINFIKQKYGDEELKKATRGLNNNILLNVVYYPNINVYNGNSTVQIVIDKFC